MNCLHFVLIKSWHLHLALVSHIYGKPWQLPHSPPERNRHNRGKTTHQAVHIHINKQKKKISNLITKMFLNTLHKLHAKVKIVGFKYLNYPQTDMAENETMPLLLHIC